MLLTTQRALSSLYYVCHFSGGKDSCYNMMQCVSAGHQIVALANLQPSEKGKSHHPVHDWKWLYRVAFTRLCIATFAVSLACLLLLDELDSFMFQTVGHEGVAAYAEAMRLPLYRKVTSGLAVKKELVYSPEAGDEVEDLYQLMKTVKVGGLPCSECMRFGLESI